MRVKNAVFGVIDAFCVDWKLTGINEKPRVDWCLAGLSF